MKEIKRRGETRGVENRKTIQKIDETESFGKINNTGKLLE